MTQLAPEVGQRLPALLERIRTLAIATDKDQGWGLVDPSALVPRTVEILG